MQSDSHREHLLFVISAPSGCGKTTLCREVQRLVPDLAFSVSHTTRAPRAGESDGENYFFISTKQFQQSLDRGEMAEWTEIYGNRYGTARRTIDELFDRGCDVLFDIDEPGARQLKNAYPNVITGLLKRSGPCAGMTSSWSMTPSPRRSTACAALLSVNAAAVTGNSSRNCLHERRARKNNHRP